MNRNTNSIPLQKGENCLVDIRETSNNQCGTLTPTVLRCLYSRLDCKQAPLYAEDGGLSTRRPNGSVSHKDKPTWLAQLQRVGSKPPGCRIQAHPP